MPGHTLLLQLLGGIALLIWATRLVRVGMDRAFGARLRRAVSQATAGPVRACLTGLGVATALQSSSATGLLTVSFAERGLIALAPALALMLGADIGSTLVVQLLSLGGGLLAPALLVAGVPLALASRSGQAREIGGILVGLALMMLSLTLIVGASEPLRGNAALAAILARLGDDPIMAAVIGAALAWLAHSSVATVLLVMSLAGGGVIGPALGIALVIGANVGSGLVPLGLGLQGPAAGRRVLIGNLAFRLIGAVVALAAIDGLAGLVAWLGADPARQIANAHTGFNVLLALALLPFTGLAASLLARLVTDPETSGDKPLDHLDDGAFERPAVAFGNATREVIRLADLVETMLRDSLAAFSEPDERRRQDISRLDDEIDRRQEALKLYLTRLSRQPLGEDERQRCFDLILFTTNLEHVGDIVDKGLLRLAAKKHRHRLSFSEAGWAEIEALHRRVRDQMRLAVTVFMTGDLAVARELVAEKDGIRAAERGAMESHLERLRDGTVASIETSALHLDILRDLKRIAAHLTAVAYPILEANGALRTSRLVVDPAAKPAVGQA